MIAVIFATLMAVSVGSFLKLANHENRLSNIAFHSNSSLNLAEGGLEMALYALNNEDFSGWRLTGTTAVMNRREVDLGKNTVGIINARILNFDKNPTVQAEGRIDLPNRPSVTKQVEIKLIRRSLFANGITARNGVTFKGGNAYVDSYSSSSGVPSSRMEENHDNGSVASVSVETEAVSISNAKIYGYVSTGGSEPSVGPNGKIFGKDTPSGVNKDPNRIALDFAADFPEVVPPSNYDGGYIPNLSRGTLGDRNATVPTVYRVGRISVKSNDVLSIQGPVVLHVLGNVDVKGEVVIENRPGNFAVIYLDDDLDIGGNGAVNNLTNRPESLLIYGSNPVRQTIKLHGNGILYAAVYAPNASLELKGGGNSGAMGGAVVANDVFINGNYQFHYDEDLADFGRDTSYRMDKWRELHLAADRVSF